jgi:hypothetical protein
MRVSRYTLPGAILTAAVLSSTLAGAEAQVGAIDWTTRTIKCKGQASPSPTATNISQARIGAERAAKLDAARNILETLKGVEIAGAKTAADAMNDPGVRSRVQGIIKNFVVTDTRYYSDGGVEVDVQMPLDGLVGSLVPEASAKAAAPASAPSATGLVVDARDLKVKPALAPRIVDETGKEVYGTAEADPAKVKDGMAGYSKDLEAAQKDPRVGSQPTVVKAKGLSPDAPTDIVISNDDAKKARDTKLAEGNVVIVVPANEVLAEGTVPTATPGATSTKHTPGAP